jgi:hypothetical protein
MKDIQSKSLLTLIIIFFIIGFSTSAKNILGTDSGIITDSLSPNTAVESALVQNPDYVIYPASLEEHREESKSYVKQYSSRERSYIIHMFNKGKGFFPKVVQIFDKYDLPLELQVLPALESNFNANAVSNAGAVGYWQFMSELAGEYGLSVNGKTDERKNFYKSTVAASKFFKDQLRFFKGDLLLTVAAFNCGQGRVRLAMKKTNEVNPDFWDVKRYLPNETRIFVMKFISMSVIAANYDKFIARKLNFNEPHLVQLASLDSSKNDISISRNSL